MRITVELPDDLSARTAPAREAIEAFALAGYRSGALSSKVARQLLGFETSYEFDGFLKRHHVFDWAYSIADLESDLAGLDQLV